MGIKFNDPNNWLDIIKAGVKKAYFIPKVFNGDGICVDIGANVGAFTIINANKFNEIHCYEPANYTYNECLKNLQNINHAKVYNLAVTNKTGDSLKLKSHKHGNVSGNASLLDNSQWDDNNFEMVNTISLSDIIVDLNLKNKKNYVKIDTEGSEYNMLLNTNLEDINYLAVEIHLQLGEIKRQELMEYLNKYFNILNKKGNSGSHYEITYSNKKI